MRLVRFAAGLCTLSSLCALPLLGATMGGSPSIIVNGDAPPPTSVMTDSFSFGADANGGGISSFTNDSGQTWTQLDIFFTLPGFETIICQTNLFATCTQTATSGPNAVFYDLTLSGPGTFTTNDAIDAFLSFTINLNNNGSTTVDSGSWSPGHDFTATANLPEPAPIALGGLGLLLFVGYRFFACRFAPKRFSKAAN